jgi:TolB-like protein/class 3 adenylate cyclase
MAADEGERKLAAILAADVAGYSRLMADDDRATVAALKQAREIFRARIEARGGRVIDTTGDSVLAEFRSDVEAVEAAIDIQEQLAEINAPLPAERKMLFRIGVNQGDVIEESDGTLYGSGVNVAARLEGLAEPGTITISARVYDDVEERLDLTVIDIGEHEVKNISKPVRAYRLVLGEDVRSVVGGQRKSATKTSIVIAAALAVIVIIGGLVWWQSRAPEPVEMVTADGSPTDDPVLAAPTGPAIAVLPFNNISNDPEYEYFSDGLTEDIITALSRFQDLFVIGRNSTFKFKGASVDVREVGRDLGVRYVLQGSVRLAGETLRVTSQLLDTETSAQIWGESYDRALSADTIFSVQDEITEKVVATIADSYGVISQVEFEESKDHGTANLEAYQCVLRAYEHWRGLTPKGHLRARDCLERAVELDPDYATAWAWLSLLYRQEYVHSFNPRPESYDALDAALEAAQRAVSLDNRSQAAHHALADTHYFRHDLGAFLISAERALTLNPNNSDVLGSLGLRMANSGNWQRGLALVEKAAAINPHHPGWFYFPYFFNEYRQANYEVALAYAQKINMEGFYWTHILLAMAHAQLGNLNEAESAVNTLRGLKPDYADDPRATFRKWNFPEALIEKMVEGLKKAGLFDESEPPSRPVIAVLPFANMSGDPEQEYFADGITEDIITRLSRFGEIGVIARNSVFQYKGQATDVRKVGKALGAHYVVEGSIRRSSERIRVTAQLLDAGDGTHLWAETYDRDLTAGDIFDIQDAITAQIATTVADPVGGMVSQAGIEQTRQRGTANIGAYDCVLRAHAYFATFDPSVHSLTRDCLEATIGKDPGYADAWAWLTLVYADEYAFAYNTLPNALDRAVTAGRKATELDPANQTAHWFLARSLFFQHELGQFLVEAERAIELNPNNAAVTAAAGSYLSWAGQWERGKALIEQALAVNPHPPGWYYFPLFYYHYRVGDFEAALTEAESINVPTIFWNHVVLAAGYGQLSRQAEAATAAERLLAVYPDFEANAFNEFRKYNFSDELSALMADGLRKAGLEIPVEVY